MVTVEVHLIQPVGVADHPEKLMKTDTRHLIEVVRPNRQPGRWENVKMKIELCFVFVRFRIKIKI